MPQTLDDIARLRAAQTIILTPSHETNITRAQFEKLLVAAELQVRRRLRWRWLLSPLRGIAILLAELRSRNEKLSS
jgi:hypothetical protein